MAKISEALTYGLTIRESATDGSDFTNPTTDYRRLFLGEDGQLHVKDSAGTVTDIGSGSGDVATDPIWDAAGDLAVGTGANTAAKLTKGADGGVLAMGNGAVIWNAGTAFPGSAATGDRYFRTDLGLEAYWDGSQWVSSNVFIAANIPTELNTGQTTSASIFNRQVFWRPTYNVYLLSLYVTVYVVTTNTGSAYWTIVLANGDTSATIASGNTSADAADTTLTKAIAVNAAFTGSATYIHHDKTGSPGTLYLTTSLAYRLILT